MSVDNVYGNGSDLLLQPNERPKLGLWIIMSFQHVFAMFGATVLVPMLTGLPVSVTLVASGIGTLLYIVSTKASVPVYLGSSFAYIAAIQYFTHANVPNFDGIPNFAAVGTALMAVGLTKVIVAMIIKLVGTEWLQKLLPPVIIGPMIMIIGLSLAPTAVSQAGLSVTNFNGEYAFIALATVLITALLAVAAKGFFKIVPFLGGIIGGYVLSLVMQSFFGFNALIDFAPVAQASFFALPKFYIPFLDYQLDFSGVALFLPICLVTIAEHIGDHTVLGKICGRNFIKEPGLHRTLTGDGLATLVSGFLGGPADTTYGENTSVVGMTKIASVYVTGLAAVIAILLGFSGTITQLIYSIPNPVKGGISIILFGVIASNGVRVLIDNQVDLGKQRNLIIASTMLVFGLGGAALQLNTVAQLTGMSLAAVVGIIMNWILPNGDTKNEINVVKENKETNIIIEEEKELQTV